MKLLQINASEFPHLKKLDDKYWQLTSDYKVELITDEGTLSYCMYSGWITDLRSGSSVIDCIVPKKGNKYYDAVILTHDSNYSGHVSKDVADDLLRQGMIMSGLSSWRAKLAYIAVQAFGKGGYYSMDDAMPEPYTNNRCFENFKWKSHV